MAADRVERLGWLTLWLALSGCEATPIPFECERDQQCVLDGEQGSCLGNGYCAFADDNCNSGLSYSDYSSDEWRGQCVETCAHSLSLGEKHTCVVLESGAVRCFGDDRQGQSSGAPSSRENALDPAQLSLPASLSFSSDRVSPISSARAENCTIVGEGEFFCWGGFYQFDQVQDDLSRITDDEGPAFQVGVGSELTCARFRDGVGCWSTTENDPQSTLFSLGQDVLDIAVGRLHGCARISDGTRGERVMCFGDNRRAQRTVPLVGVEAGPNLVLQLDNVDQLALGDDHSCALSDGDVWCWGNNLSRQIGDPDAPPIVGNPTQVSLDVEFTQIAAGQEHNCALTADGDVYCWGNNAFGQLGAVAELESTDDNAADGGATLDGDESELGSLRQVGVATPQRVPLDEPAAAVYAGGGHSCALLESGRASCWGNNDRGQLGTGDRQSKAEPVAVSPTAIACD